MVRQHAGQGPHGLGGRLQIARDLGPDPLIEDGDQVLGQIQSIVAVAVVRVERGRDDGADDQDHARERNAEAADPSPELSPRLLRIDVNVDDVVAAHLADLGRPRSFWASLGSARFCA